MDDLISRKALDDAFTELRWNEDGTLNHFGDRPDWCMHGIAVDKLIQNAPSVPAVPLDKLCEWLDYHAGKPLDCVGEQCIKCKFGVTDSGNGNCWKAMLTKWMEEQDVQKEN